MLATSPKKDINLNFSMQKVKSSIEAICTNPKTGCRIIDKNQLFNTYRVSIVKSFSTGIMSITLNNDGVEKTHSSFEIHNTVGGIAQPATLASLQDYFLQLLSSSLDNKWEEMENYLSFKSKTSNNNLTIILIAAIIIAVICIAGFMYNSSIH